MYGERSNLYRSYTEYYHTLWYGIMLGYNPQSCDHEGHGLNVMEQQSMDVVQSVWLSWIVPITIKNTPWVPHLSLLHIPQSSLQCTVEGWNSLTLCHTRGTAWHCETAQGAKLWHQCLQWGELPVCVCNLHKTRFLTYQSYLQSGQTAVDLALQGGSDAMVAALLDWDIVTSSSNCMHVHCAQCNC